MVITKKYIYAKPFVGMPTVENFELVTEELPALNNGEYLTEAIYWSVDPYLRTHSGSVGDTMTGAQVAKIIESKSNKFPVGKHVVGEFGWTTHTIEKDDAPITSWGTPQLVPFDEKNVPLSLALGALGMPGNTAYFGLVEVCRLQPGETVAITAAGGAVGSHFGQIAKIKGCTVIGITGSDEKAKWLRSLNFDHVINYKSGEFTKALAKATPEGIDCYFDNVGGEISSIILKNMNISGRVAICGAIAAYNSLDNEPKATMIQTSILLKRLTLRGFWIHEFVDRLQEGVTQNLKWINEGKLTYKEHVTEGFENLPLALIGVLKGENIGKAIVKS